MLDSTDAAFSSIYNGMAICYHRANRLQEAKRFYLKSKEIAEAQFGPVSSDLAICLSNLSVISRSEENYREAIDYSREALRIYHALDDDSGKAAAYYALGIYYFYLGDYGQTRDYLEACIDIRERLYDPVHFSLIGPYELLGITYEASGDYPSTLRYLRKVRGIIRSNYGPGSPPEAFNYENTALSFQSLGNLDSALHYIARANPILTQRLDPNDYSMGVHYFSYAHILYQKGDLKAARARLERSNQVYQALELDRATEYAGNLALAALIAAEAGEWEAADRQFREALGRIRLPGTAAFVPAPAALTVLNDYVGYLYRRYRFTGRETDLQTFRQNAEEYRRLADRFRRQFIDPYTRSVLIRESAEAYEQQVGIYARLYRETGQAEYLEEVYRFSEYGRAALLRDLQDEKIERYAGLPDDVLVRERTLKKQIAQLEEATLNYPDSVALVERLLEEKRAFDRHLEQTLQDYPRYFELKYQDQIPDLGELRAQLPPSRNLIEYLQDDTAYYALLIQNEAIHLRHLGARVTIDSLVQEWRRAVTNLDESGWRPAADGLWRMLWEPLEPLLRGGEVMIVPAGPLFYINFETLAPARRPDAYLIRDYRISYALSLSLLYSESEARKQGRLLAVAPGFEPELKDRYRAQLDSLSLPDATYLQAIRQPWSVRLARKLRRRWGAVVLTGERATERAVREKLQQGSSVLFFGTHALADPADPLRSKLILTKEAEPQAEDGYLHAYELFGLPLRADLAVLNACESGLGLLRKGEGMISLAYGMHYAGCPSTAMSLWKVDEKVSLEITETFLDLLAKGYGKSEALRQAKLSYLEGAPGPTRAPFYWGGMVLLGDTAPVSLQRGGFPTWLLVFGGVMLLGVVFGIVRRWILRHFQ